MLLLGSGKTGRDIQSSETTVDGVRVVVMSSVAVTRTSVTVAFGVTVVIVCACSLLLGPGTTCLGVDVGDAVGRGGGVALGWQDAKVSISKGMMYLGFIIISVYGINQLAGWNGGVNF